MSSDQKILIGKVVGASGIKGEVKIYHYSNDLDSLSKYGEVYLGDIGYTIEGIRQGKGTTIVKLQGIDDRNAAEEMVDFGVYIEENKLEELPEDTYYVRDLVGLEVIDIDGKSVGKIRDVLQNTAQDVYVISTEKGDVMVPAVKEFVKTVNPKEGFVTIEFIEGMLP